MVEDQGKKVAHPGCGQALEAQPVPGGITPERGRKGRDDQG
jgi:hypothetical protein